MSTRPAPSWPRADRPLDRREPLRRDELREEPTDDADEADGVEDLDGAADAGDAVAAGAAGDATEAGDAAASPQTVQ
jgi:hypothetical protein